MAWRHDGTTETAWVLLVSSNYFSMVHAPVIAGQSACRSGSGRRAVGGDRRAILAGEAAVAIARRPHPAPEQHRRHGVGRDPGVVPRTRRHLFARRVAAARRRWRSSAAPARLQARDARWLFVLGQLAPGVSIAEVQGRLDAAAAAMARDWPETHRERGARFRLFSEGNTELRAVGSIAGVGDGHHRPRAAARLLQRGQPAARPRRRARARHGHPRGARREARRG